MENHATRRKIIRQWASLPKDKRQTAEQAAEFAKKAIEQNELQSSRRDPYQRVMGWLLPRWPVTAALKSPRLRGMDLLRVHIQRAQSTTSFLEG